MTPGARLAGRTALVTGGGRGIGRETALIMAAAGAAVMITDIDGDKAADAAAAIRDNGGEAHAFTADVSDAKAVDRLFVATVEQFSGRLDILVANAGVPHHQAFLDMPLEEWDRVLKTNLTSVFLCAQRAARVMASRKYGRIITLGSISGQRGSFGRAAYGTTKAGIMQLTRIMAVELAPMGITVNSIAPGPIDTGITKFGPSQEQSYLSRIPAGRFGLAHEIADAALYLAGENAGFVTGSVINVDGGFDAAGLMFSYDELTSFKSDERDNEKSD